MASQLIQSKTKNKKYVCVSSEMSKIIRVGRSEIFFFYFFLRSHGQTVFPTSCPPLSRKCGDIKSHSSVRQSVRLSVSPSVTKTLTLAITFALLQVELWHLACVFIVTLPFWWYHVVTLTVTFDLLQGQICCRAGDHNSLNFFCFFYIQKTVITVQIGNRCALWGILCSVDHKTASLSKR